MNKSLLTLLLLAFSANGFSQMELPEYEGCTLLQKNGISYCIDSESYKVAWTALKLYANDIENNRFTPPDGEFFKDMPPSVSPIWHKIEKQVRFWSIEFDSLYVVTGKTMIQTDTAKAPTPAYYKAILKGCQGDAIGFLVNTEAPNNQAIANYCIHLDSIESISGLDLFPTLDIYLQETIEPTFDTLYWPFTNFNIR